MRHLVLLLLFSACAPARPLAQVGPADGTILDRGPCPVLDPPAFEAAVDAYYRADIAKAGLGEQLAGRPLSSLVTADENARYAAATAAGRCERVVYASDGLRVVGFVVRPPTPGPHPALIWLRSGNQAFGAIAPVTLLNLAWLADAGFVLVAPQYRGVDGGEGHDEFGGADVDDVMALVPLARSLPEADVERLVLLGGSRWRASWRCARDYT